MAVMTPNETESCSPQPGMRLGFRKLRLFQLRTVWCPTLLGALCGIVLLLIPVLWWVWYAESFLSLTSRSPAEILVVEGWIGRDGTRAAAAEFEQQGYRYIVTAGERDSSSWEEIQMSFADLAGRELIRLGVPKDKVILAPAAESQNERTYQSALAVWRTLQGMGIRPKGINVFTLGSHARRSRLVFAKVEGPETKVGVIGWVPANYRDAPWWGSSDRTKRLITETGGYLFEALFNSGRYSNSRH